MDEVIVRNSARCLACGDEIESTHRHDFRTCSCGAISVDGGIDYLRRGWVEDERFKGMDDTSILAPEEPRSHVLENSGIHVGGVHHSARCAGRPCPIHNRSDHALRSWPQVWHLGRVMRVNPFGGWCSDPDEPGNPPCLSCDILPFTGRKVCESFEIEGSPAALLGGYRGYAATRDGRIWTFHRLRGPSYGNAWVIDFTRAPDLLKSSDPGMSKQRQAYLRASLIDNQGAVDNVRVHNVILSAFRGERPDGMECRHLDGDPRRNALENLAWGTRTDNADDRSRHGSVPHGDGHSNSRLTADDVVEARRLWRDGVPLDALAEKYRVSRSTIHEAVTGATWTSLDHMAPPTPTGTARKR